MTQATIGTKAPFDSPSHSFPGSGAKMMPRPDLGEATYKGSWHLADKRAIITGGDSGIGAAVAIAFALGIVRLVIGYLDETDDPNEVRVGREGWPHVHAGAG